MIEKKQPMTSIVHRPAGAMAKSELSGARGQSSLS
jgi:hypothetical protein